MPDDHINAVDPERLDISRGVTKVVKQAASILQREINEGSARTTKMQGNFATTRKVDPNEFKLLSERVRKDVHDLIAMAGEMFSELQTTEVQSMVSRMATDAHDVVETTMNLVENTPAAATTFARLGFTTPPPPNPSDDTPDPTPDAGGDPPTPNA